MLLLVATFMSASEGLHVGSESRRIVVPDDYPTIQEAVNAANIADTIYVKTGTYYESVVVNKTVSLIGESKDTTAIVAGWEGDAFYVKADNVSIRGFAIRRSNGILVDGSSNSSISGNNIEGEVEVVDFDVYFYGNGIRLHNSSNCSVSENNINLTQVAICSSGSANCSISRNNVMSNYCGIVLESSSNTLLSNNTAYYNFYGIVLGGFMYIRPSPSTNSVLRNNNMTSNRYNFGIGGFLHKRLDEFIHDIDSSNTVDAKPIYYLVNQHDKVVPSDAGYVAIVNSTNITVQNLTLTNNMEGVLLACTTNSTIREVTAAGNLLGFHIFASSDNVIYHNNFPNNRYLHAVAYPGFANRWDNGYPSGGNYWGGYSGVDWYRGPFQNETGSDGIADSPYTYIIDGENTDNYPLMKPYPWGTHDVGITRVESKSVIGQGFDLHINVTVFNYGMFAETFNASAYASTTAIQTKTITLKSRDATAITFTWNTAGVAKGNHIITAMTTPVLGETDTADNTITHSVTVAIVGDITGPDGYPDGKVDIRDIYTVAKAFGSYPSHKYWNPNADINNDDRVDINDIFIVAKHFGQADP